MNAENFLSMLKFDAVEYSIDLKKYCPDINEIGLNNNPDNKTSSDKKYSNQIESKYNKEESIVETKLDKKLSNDNKIPNVLHNNKYRIDLRNNLSINSIAKTCWTNLDKSNLDKLSLARQPGLS